MLKHRQYIFFMFFSRATLNETFTAKYDGVLPRTPEVRPKSEIYPPKRDDEHPHPFHMWSPPPPREFNLTTNARISAQGAYFFFSNSKLRW